MLSIKYGSAILTVSNAAKVNKANQVDNKILVILSDNYVTPTFIDFYWVGDPVTIHNDVHVRISIDVYIGFVIYRSGYYQFV